MKLYEIKFTTWENDGDDYATVSKILTSQEDVDFYKQLAFKFISCNSNYNAGLGNEEADLESLMEMIQELMEEHPNMSQAMKAEWLETMQDESGESTYDKLCEEILSDPVQYDYGFCRVLESATDREIEPGKWLKVNGKDVIFEDYQNNEVIYRYSIHPKMSDGKIDVSKLEWQTGTCSLTDFEVVSSPNEVSKAVLKIK